MGKRSSATLPRVSDFSTLVGSAKRNMPMSHRYQLRNSSTWFTNNDTTVVGLRFKSPVVKGAIDPYTGYRKATSYSRIIHVCSNSTASFQWRTRQLQFPNDPDPRLDELTNPIGGPGFTIIDGGMYSTTSGAVNVNPDYSNRAIAEAYDSLLQGKINLAVTAAEIGEVLGWFASIVKRLVEALLIVKDALRGRVNAAAAKRKLRSIAARNPVTTRKSSNRQKDADYRGQSNTDRRWQAVNRRYAWEKEVAKRYARQNAARMQAMSNSRKRPKTDKVSSAWLEYQYALMPLVYDVYGALEVLKDGLRQDNFLFTVQRTIGGPIDPARFVYSANPHSVVGKARQSSRVRLAGRMHATVLTAAAELGLTNPWLVVWELVPFSFVVDWILPIGKVLSSYTAPVGVSFVDGSLTKVAYGDWTAQRLPPGGSVIIGNPPEARFKLLAMQRQSYLTWPVALPYLRSPWSYTHTMTALALMSQLTKR